MYTLYIYTHTAIKLIARVLFLSLMLPARNVHVSEEATHERVGMRGNRFGSCRYQRVILIQDVKRVFRVVELGLVVYRRLYWRRSRARESCVEIVFAAHFFFFHSRYSRRDNYFTRVCPDSLSRCLSGDRLN